MFKRKTLNTTVQGIEMCLMEMPKKLAFAVEAIKDLNAQATALFKNVVHKPDGTPFFASDAEIDELPSSVVVEIGDRIKELVAPKH